MSKRIVIALGGNALGKTPEEQIEKIRYATPSLIKLISDGYEIIVTHGNGPQVGMINLAFSEGSKVNEKIPTLDLPECSAMSQGYIGYHLQQCIKRELRSYGMPWHVATMITQVEVDKDDEAFNNPTKPIGIYYTKEEADKKMLKNPDIVFKEDSGRGYRQVVASPKPKYIIEKDSILNLLDNEFIVIACGGGGIPVIKIGDGIYKGVNAVIDKDFASALLAEEVNADYLFILTAVDKVSINFGKPTQKDIDKMDISTAQKYADEGQFGEGSMKPKVLAGIKFAQSKKGRKAVIASLEKVEEAIAEKSGTIIEM